MNPQLKRMVDEQIRSRGIQDPRVLGALERVPRELFVADAQRPWAYEDFPLEIACGQTISQPYIVALISELLELSGTEKVLEVGAGSGYQAAVLAILAAQVVAVEWHAELAASAAKRLGDLELENVLVVNGDGKEGYASGAPYDRIVVSACLAQEEVPGEWHRQLREGGLLLLPQGREPYQTLYRLRRKMVGWEREPICGVRFVPVR